jgi:CO/xanthine dehydrogenase FAD-binding subunit
MITFDFDYYKPDSSEETLKVFKKTAEQGKTAIYYAGGTEIISFARVNRIHFDAVIDIKGIPELNVLEFRGDKLVIGAAVTLTKISDSCLFPLLSSVCKSAADHTSRDKITIGGNICGKTLYKEAVLPLLLADADVIISGMSGTRSAPLDDVFNKSIQIGNGEFLIQIIVDKKYISLPYANVKKTRQDRMGYPLLTVAAVESDKQIRMAFSGLCPFPFRSKTIEEKLNVTNLSVEEKIQNVITVLPDKILNDIISSAEYREFVAGNAISDIIERFRGQHA